ncbi:MAG: cold-shock protein [Limisphaerales bacterium]|jgi:CspA family cold shock protein|nr:cold-shock protein [Verrucomicrobiota bacterium]
MTQQGTVKWFDPEKGYGFILQENGQDLFVHKSALDGDILNEGEQVEFEIGEGRKGPIAENVKVIS